MIKLIRNFIPLQGWKAGLVIIISQIAASIIVNLLSYRTLSKILPVLKPFSWEKDGDIYEKLFHIRAWKDYIPSVSAFDKKNLSMNPDKAYLSKFILESVRAELCHVAAVLFGLLIYLITPDDTRRKIIIWIIAMNIPCIMIQRFNRPRLEKILFRLHGCTSGIVRFWEDGKIRNQERT